MRLWLTLSSLVALMMPLRVLADCGGTFTSAEGDIKSPRYPKKYPHNSYCVYNILASDDARTKVTCKMNLKGGYGCVADYLMISGAVFCGKTKIKNVYGAGSFAITFVSDGSLSAKKGFSCNYKRLVGSDYVSTSSPQPSSTTIPPTTSTTTTIPPTTSTTTTIPPTTSTTTTTIPPTTSTTTTIPPTTSTTTLPPTSTQTPSTSTTLPPDPPTPSPSTSTPLTSAPSPATPSTTLNPSPPSTTDGGDGTSCEDVLETISLWNEGWNGRVTLPVLQAISSWTIEFHFTSPVTTFEQWTGSLTALSDTRYSVFKEDGNHQVGSTISFTFLYRFNLGASVPVISSIILNGVNMCEGGGGGAGTTTVTSTTQSPGTSSPTTTPSSVTNCSASDAPYDYSRVLHLSLLFYEAQRSGVLPPDQRVTWRKDSAIDDAIDDDTDTHVDLEGGYYDAGDYVKFGYPMAGAITVLAWGAIEYGDAYKAIGEMGYMLETVKWATDYFIKAHPEPNVFYGQVGNGQLDHSYWGRPEDMTMDRPAYKITQNKPGSDLAGETAAALAAAAILFQDSDSNYAATCLTHAKDLYEFSNNYRGKYADSITDAAQYYYSHGSYLDELAWAAAWLYRATGNSQYLTDAVNHYSQLSPNAEEFSWAEKKPGVQVLLAQLTDTSVNGQYLGHLESFCDNIIDNKPRTPQGLVFLLEWGSLRYAANVAFVCLRAADLGIKPTKYRDFGKQQIHYMLGDTGRSYVIGFGENYPLQPHHASSSCPPAPATCDWNTFSSNNPNYHELKGALVGGPDIGDNYVDNRQDFKANEVTTDYNAGFQSAVAALQHLSGCVGGGNNASTQQPTTTTDKGGSSSTTPESGNTGCASITETNSWSGNYQIDLAVTIPSNVSSWTLVIDFSSVVDNFQAWTAVVEQGSGSTVIISNKSYNGNQVSGHTLVLGFQITYSDAKPSINSIAFNGQTLGSC